jgi:AraC-like DNA-binding protein
MARGLRHRFTRHSHPAYALGVIEAGVGGNECRGITYYNPPGSIVAMNPGQAHTGFAAGGVPLSYRMLYISPAALKRALPEHAALPDLPRSPVIEDDRLYRELIDLHHCLEASVAHLKIQSRFIAFVERLVATFDCPFKMSAREPQAVQQVKDYLQAHYKGSVSLEALSALTGLHRSYLNRCFTKSVGIPPYSYLIQIRVDASKRLLASGTLPVDTALEVGFADQSHLTRHFKRITGITPASYAKGHNRTRKA